MARTIASPRPISGIALHTAAGEREKPPKLCGRSSAADADLALDVLGDGDTVGVRVTRLGLAGCPERELDIAGDSTTSPRSLSLCPVETVALANDGRVEIAPTSAGMSATLLVSRVSQRLSRLSMATRRPVT